MTNLNEGTYWIPAGDEGTLATLGYMAQLSMRGAVTPECRGVAARCVLGAGRDPLFHARLLRDWVDSHTEFLADPTIAEGLTPPEKLVRSIQDRGIGQCDCDDVAMLAAALGMSIGLRARFVVVAFGTDVTSPFAHVWCELAAPDGRQWLIVDPTRPVLGLPSISRMQIMEVT